MSKVMTTVSVVMLTISALTSAASFEAGYYAIGVLTGFAVLFFCVQLRKYGNPAQ